MKQHHDRDQSEQHDVSDDNGTQPAEEPAAHEIDTERSGERSRSEPATMSGVNRARTFREQREAIALTHISRLMRGPDSPAPKN